MPQFAEVVVNRPIVRRPVTSTPEQPVEEGTADANPLARTFSYLIPESMRGQVAPGQMVEVPFRETTLQGVIVGLSDTPPPHVSPRPITSILERTPVLSPVQLQLAHWLSGYYLAPLSECVWLFLPPGARRSPQVMVEAVPDRTLPPDTDARAAALYLYLSQKGATPAEELEASTVKILADIEAVRTWQRLAPPRAAPYMDRTVEMIATQDEAAAALPRLGHASRQADVLLHLASLSDPLPALADVLTEVGCGEDVGRRLVRHGYVRLTPRRVLVASPLTGEALQTALAEMEAKPAQRAALQYLRDHPGPQLVSDSDIPTAVFSDLEKRGYVRRWSEPATVSLAIDPDEVLPAVIELRGATRHATVLDMLAREEGQVWIGWVYVQTEATWETLCHLQEAGLVSLDEARRWRDPLGERAFVLETPPCLTQEQSAAWEQILPSLPKKGARHDLPCPPAPPLSPEQEEQIPPSLSGKGARGLGPPDSRAFLLHGVTGSGKTEIYLRAVADVLERGQGAIFLVPEIALATQTIQRVAARFPGKVAVWHSDLSLGQRFDTWQRVRDGELSVVVGPRSALFAPVRNLGLIVVDEEHEPAYKQERAPRYHARDVALELSRLTGATVILGSATPDVATYRRAERGELALLTLPRRVLAHRQYLVGQIGRGWTAGAPVTGFEDLRTLPLPPVEVVDLAAELKAGNRSIFSRALQHAMLETLAAGQQIILFLNRRGTATFVLCRDCGYVMSCPRCHLPFTYHDPLAHVCTSVSLREKTGDYRTHASLICHQCNRRQPNPERCPKCKSSRIRYFGLGTERVEAAVRQAFPSARPLRWDLDTARPRGSHAAYLEEFATGQANVLIGTQMIAKGLDLPRVTLVGVISADTSLFLPDFRAGERTFQLLTQVAGRAGRSPLGGRVIVQTYHPELPLIRAAAGHDYATFYRDELESRRAGRYPPFKRLARLVFSGPGAERAQREAERMAAFLKQYVARLGEPGVEVVGPAPCFYPRLGGEYRWHILLRANQPEALLRPLTLPLGWRVDVDPVDLL